MTTQPRSEMRRLISLALILVSAIPVARSVWAGPSERPQATASYVHAPVTLWLAPHVGAFGMTSGKLKTNLALSLGASGYARLEGLDLGVAASWITEEMRGLQITSGLNHVGGEAWGAQIAAGANLARGGMVGLQVASGFNYSGSDLRGVQIAIGSNGVRERAIGLQVASGFNYGSTIAGAQIGLVNFGGDVSGAQIGLINIGRRVKGTQIGLLNVAEDSSAPVGLLSVVKNGQHHLALWTSDSAPISLGLKLGGQYLYSVLAVGFETSDDKKRWLAGTGIGGHLPISERFFVEAELIAWHVNEERAWSTDTNWLNTLRLVGGYSVWRHLSFFAGPSLNLLVSEAGDGEGFGLIRGTRLSSEGSKRTVRLWPGFVAGVQI